MNLKETSLRLLKKHKLRKTDVREQVLSVFLDADVALNNQDVEERLNAEVDRITLYRTLNKFVEHGLIHRIENGTNTHYAVCKDCEYHNHDDNHVHFKCSSCEQIECFDQKKSFEFSLPSNYQFNKVNVLLEGICEECKYD